MQAGDVHRQDNAEVTAPFENDAKAAKKVLLHRSWGAQPTCRAANGLICRRRLITRDFLRQRLCSGHSSLPTKAWGGICCYSVNGVELLDDAPKSNECWLLDAISKPCPMFYSRG